MVGLVCPHCDRDHRFACPQAVAAAIEVAEAGTEARIVALLPKFQLSRRARLLASTGLTR